MSRKLSAMVEQFSDNKPKSKIVRLKAQKREGSMNFEVFCL